MRTLLTILVLAFCLPSPALAQGKTKSGKALVQEDKDEETDKIYSWVDGRGAWHFVDSLEMVPRGYKSQARANAMRATRTANKAARTAKATPAGPTVRRTPTTATEAPMTDGERTMKIRQLQRRLMTLEGEIAALEEGNVPDSYLKSVGSEAELTDAKLEELLSRTEAEIVEVQAQIDALKD